jgi:hypothetical protein
VSGGEAFGVPVKNWRMAALAGVGMGIAYVLSPLSVWFGVAMALLVRSAVSGFDDRERRWLLTLLVTAIVLRLAAIGGLFLLTNHGQMPFGSFFGDEEYFIKRSIWLRNVALGIPVHAADLVYAFDEYSATSYLYVLAFIQVLVGPAPYGAHLLGVAFYLAGSVILYRTVRPAFGRMPALIGLGLLLFLPSLFAWSISALKEPLFFLLTASSLSLILRVIRGPGAWRRLLAGGAVAVIAIAIETVRPAGGLLSLASLAGGVAFAVVVRRPRLLIVSMVALPILAGAALAYPQVQLKAYSSVQAAARQHWGHVATPGYVYRLLDERFYPNRSEISDIEFRESAKFVARAIGMYLTVPLPWEVQSRPALAYVPEQIVWYILVVLLPVGVVFACRRDPLIGGLLFAHALIAAVTVALISGNVGTLVRHRGLALPYLVWLSAVGLCGLISPATHPGRTAGSLS